MSIKPCPLDISSLPYSKRQLIVVQSDKIVAASRASNTAETPSNSIDWKKVAWTAVLGWPFTSGLPAITLILGKEAYNAWVKARESGLDVLQISTTEAAQLTLQPGHPRNKILYVAHPTMQSVYYTSASFHRVVFEHKFAEAVELLMSLGASHIEVEHVNGWSREFSATISAPIPQVNVEASASSKESESSSILFRADFTNEKVPCLPVNMVWYSHEPTWQSVANGRLNYGMQEFSLVVNYQDDFGVNAGLKLKVEKAGLDMGGSFGSHMVTTWKISGTFKRPCT